MGIRVIEQSERVAVRNQVRPLSEAIAYGQPPPGRADIVIDRSPIPPPREPAEDPASSAQPRSEQLCPSSSHFTGRVGRSHALAGWAAVVLSGLACLLVGAALIVGWTARPTADLARIRASILTVEHQLDRVEEQLQHLTSAPGRQVPAPVATATAQPPWQWTVTVPQAERLHLAISRTGVVGESAPAIVRSTNLRTGDIRYAFLAAVAGAGYAGDLELAFAARPVSAALPVRSGDKVLLEWVNAPQSVRNQVQSIRVPAPTYRREREPQ